MAQTFAAHGKLLLTAEYFVLDGALALALPAKLGQTLEVAGENAPSTPAETGWLHWQSFDEQGDCWFEARFGTGDIALLQSSDDAVAARLQNILREARRMQPSFLAPTGHHRHFSAKSRLGFPRQWGLGTSSTLISLLAQWAGVDAFELQFRTFGGSGYDIACATATAPLLYDLAEGKPHVSACDFAPAFADSLYFVYLGQKQDSREGIRRYRQRFAAGGEKADALPSLLDRASRLTHRFLAAKSLDEFEGLLREHEALVAETLGLERAKALFFQDFWGEIKSLGAWGGDFVLATSNRPAEETRRYFNEKGFGVFLPYEQLVAGAIGLLPDSTKRVA